MKKIKITILIIMLLCVKLVNGQCPSFEYEGVNSGHDFLNLSKYSNIEICESSGSIELGSKTFYIVGKAYRNGYGQGDFIYDIQEARGYWPKIGFVKVAKDFSLIQLKFMNSVVTYNVSIKKEKGEDIIITGDYFAKDDENNKLSLKFSGNTVCTKHENDKLSYCYQFEQVKSNDLKSIGDFSYTGDLSFMKNVKGTFELTSQKLKLSWGNNEANYIITGIDNSEKIEKERQDNLIIKEINSEISSGRFFKAQILYKDLFYKKTDLLSTIQDGIIIYETKLNKLYNIYKDTFNQRIKELNKNENEFLKKYNNITFKRINTKSFNLDSLTQKSLLNINSDKNTSYELKDNLYFYSKSENKHFLCPVGIKSNFFTQRYDTNFVDKIKVLVKFDTILNNHFGEIVFLNKNKIYSSGLIYNSFSLDIKSYFLDYPKNLNDLIIDIKDQGGSVLLSKYPLLTHYFNHEETIPYQRIEKISNPSDGLIDNKYQDLRKKFLEYDMKLSFILNNKNFQNEKVLAAKNFYNPLLLILSKSLFPEADSIMFEFSFDKSFENLGEYEDKTIKINTALNDAYFFEEQIGRIIPLIKGKIEFKNNMLLIYGKDGNINTKNIKYLEEGFYNLKNIDVNTLDLDTLFYDNKFTMLKYIYRLYSGSDKIDYMNWEPVIANQTLINLYNVGQKIESNKRMSFNYNDVNFTYYKGDNIIIQLIPTYNKFKFDNRLTVLTETKYFKKDNSSIFEYSSLKNRLMYESEKSKFGNTKKYFDYIMDFIELKKQGDINKAEKNFKKAEKIIIRE